MTKQCIIVAIPEIQHFQGIQLSRGRGRELFSKSTSIRPSPIDGRYHSSLSWRLNGTLLLRSNVSGTDIYIYIYPIKTCALKSSSQSKSFVHRLPLTLFPSNNEDAAHASPTAGAR